MIKSGSIGVFYKGLGRVFDVGMLKWLKRIFDTSPELDRKSVDGERPISWEITEAKSLEELEIGKVYATFWKAHPYPDRVRELGYSEVLDIRLDTASQECIVTTGGNRNFSKLRWFGPMPTLSTELNAHSPYANK